MKYPTLSSGAGWDKSPTATLLFWALPFFALLAHCFYYYPFMADDTFISLRYAERLLQGKGLTWNDGEVVEGYSNPSWVLLASGLKWLGFDLLSAVRLLGMLCTGLAYLALHALARYAKLHGKAPLFGAWMLVSLLSPVAIWAIGGLEAPLVLALLTWIFALSYRLIERMEPKIAAVIGLLLGVLAITRPEGALFTAMLVPGLFVVSPLRRQYKIGPLFLMGLIASLWYLGQLWFRLDYYGAFVSNTYSARMAFTASRFINGAMYVYAGLSGVLAVLLLWLVVWTDKQAKGASTPIDIRFAKLIGAIAIAWLALLVLGGGDYLFPGYRLFMPFFACMAVLTLITLKRMYAVSTPAKNHLFLACILTGVCYLQLANGHNQWTKEWGWVWEGKALGELLEKRYGCRKPLVAAGHVGALAYYGHMPVLDFYGLNDRYLTEHKKENPHFGQGFMAHELFDQEYLLTRNPDIIISEMPGKMPLCYRFPCQELMERYSPVTLELPSRSINILVRDKEVEQWKKADPFPCRT